MSRVAKNPVPLPQGVTAQLAADKVTIKGAKGSLSLVLGNDVTVSEQDKALQVAFGKFLALKSFKATLVDLGKNKPVSQVEFVAPDRYRVTPAAGNPSVIVGQAMYLNLNGKYMKVPMPIEQIIGQYRNQAVLDQLAKGMVVEDLGLDAGAGEPAHKYRYTTSGPQASTSAIWISLKSGLPLQIETGKGKVASVRVRYSDINSAAIRIDPPK